ncbi:MAG: anti-sigma factor [Betaproteobacteria bacterium]
MNPVPITDDDLHAFADGQLAGERRDAVEQALARDPSLGARVAAIRELSANLRDAFDPWLAESVPPRLVSAARGPARHGILLRGWPAFAAAATLILGVAIGWFGRDAMLEQSGTPTSFARQAAFTHVLYAADQRRPVEVWANEEASLARWLTRRMGTQAHIPDLGPLGYTLVGGRLVAGNEKPTGLVMYENADKQRVTLQWRLVKDRATESGETAFRYVHEDGVSVFHWTDDECAYALSGPFDRQRMLGIARVVYGQLAAAPRGAPAVAPAPAVVPKPAAEPPRS